jgi:hypothetical protein
MIGIEQAYPALVNTRLQHNIINLLPGVEVFDHCIVYFVHNDTSYWVDPSIPQQGGTYQSIGIYDYGAALVVGMEADTLRQMNIDYSNSQFIVTEEYTMTSFSEPASLKIESKRIGFEADQRRMFLQFISMKEVADQVSNDLGRQFPVVEQVGDFEVMDDLEKNVFTSTYYHELDGFWIDGSEEKGKGMAGIKVFRFEPILIFDYLNVNSCNARTYPAAITYPLSFNYNVIFHFPENILIEDDVDVYENEEFYYEESVKQINTNTVQLCYRLKTLTKEVSAENYTEICMQKKELKNNLPVIFYFHNQ